MVTTKRAKRRKPAAATEPPAGAKEKPDSGAESSDYGRKALDESIPSVQQARAMPAAEAEALRRRILQKMRAPLGRALDLVPSYVALRTNDPRFLLKPDEREEGVGAFIDMIDTICPNLEGLLRWLVVGHCFAWTFAIVAPRLLMLAQLRAQAAGGGPRRGSAPGPSRPQRPPSDPLDPETSEPGTPEPGDDADDADDAEGDMD